MSSANFHVPSPASPFFSLLLFTPYPSHLIPSPPRARDVRSGRRGSSATNTGSRNACRNIATNSSNNFLQHVLFECQPSSCFFTVSCGRIDFVRLRIRVIGTLNKTASGRVNCGSPSRGRSSTARFGSWQEIRSNAFPLFHGSVRWSDRRNPKQCLPVIPWLGSVMARFGHGSVRSWLGSVMARFGHGSVRSWLGSVMARKSEAMPSRYSMARFGGVTVVLAAMPSRYSTSSPAQIVDACIMNGDFWGDLSPTLRAQTDMRLLAAADRMTETERAKAIRR
ncbi:BZ3500_MvSof-1268-A1-R1_Chr6-3g08694 [Microbotryum saponariae]|uniref:BZ3500_MvSof-1268-A1-R1_Chr6-3g08694 protein n=1 Tax=Microbotryum saponariae TaxID=289078 RepID=A0A2X0KL14_9BASI|nr:BZ3500_MvSof-1268-A1-R1_Chr6-3g08694 [Microbotryum saponariae]SDA07295.1 BZ3501_MvSof-1269-A2-R1_Chr6-2g08397 [Microbotryum saponariae]